MEETGLYYVEKFENLDLAVVDYLEEDDDNWKTKEINPMLEVFGIVYLGRDNVEPRDQLGRIYMYCPQGIRDMYSVDNVDETKETITYGDEFDIEDIKGPFPYLNDCSNLCFDLFGGTYKGSLCWVFDEFKFGWREDTYVRKLRLESRDGTGKIVVLMGFYAHATIAQVEVRLNSICSNVVYGSVAASNDHLDEPLATSMLFLKDQHQGITVANDGSIPLSRSRVAVPFDAVLNLDISLVVGGRRLSTTMAFPARKTGVTKPKVFKTLLVTVTWNALKHDLEDDYEFV